MSSQTESGSSVPKHSQIISLYLSGSLPLVHEKLSNLCVKAGVQVFILGMTDMLRQVEGLDWSQFIATYDAILSAHGVVPPGGAEAFVQKVGSIASENKNVEKIMRQGAQSIQMYVVERDAEAPTDLISAVLFSEKNASSFEQLVSA